MQKAKGGIGNTVGRVETGRQGSGEESECARQCEGSEEVCLPRSPCKSATVLSISHFDNTGSTHIDQWAYPSVYINQAQRLKKESGYVFYATRGVGLQFILPSRDSSFA